MKVWLKRMGFVDVAVRGASIERDLVYRTLDRTMVLICWELPLLIIVLQVFQGVPLNNAVSSMYRLLLYTSACRA